MSQGAVQTAQPFLHKVESMITALMAQKWGEFLPYFSNDLVYKVGIAPPVHGPEACRDFLANIYKKLQPGNHVVHGTWEVGNVVIVEMDAHYNVIEDGRPVVVPCCDIYRFDSNGLIQKWNVYPDASDVRIQF